MDPERILGQRRPFEDLEALLIRATIGSPNLARDLEVQRLRYVLNFAKLDAVRTRDGSDVELGPALAPLAGRVRDACAPLKDGAKGVHAVMQRLPALLEETRDRRRRVLEHFPIDAAHLDREVRHKHFVVTCGGGGGAGYGYAGAWTLFHRRGLQPALISGTSMGSLLGLFRARRKVFDAAPLFAASERLSFERVFRILQMDSRYGVPATLRLYLRAAIGTLFLTPEGQPLTFQDLEIPLLVVATGIGVEALKHDLRYYEHFLDDAVRPGLMMGPTLMARVAQVGTIFREMLQTPDALREVVFGADEATMQADILDAAGFSSSIPGLIHYDVVRDDPRMKTLLDELYARYGITRLAEGGVVNNLPVRPAYAEVHRGRLGTRNAFYLALDCFAPRLRRAAFYPIMQITKPSVAKNMPFANFYHALDRTLNPLNLVPKSKDMVRAMDWTYAELTPHMPFIEGCVRDIPELAA